MKIFTLFSVGLVWLVCSSYAANFDDMLVSKRGSAAPLFGVHDNVKWLSHTPDPNVEVGEEADYRGQIDIGLVDLDGDKKQEAIKVTWGQGVSDHSLSVELFKDAEMRTRIAALKPTGIEPNFKLDDIDGDGKLEVILWGAVSDPAMSQDSSDTSKPFEGHSSPHFYEVSIYKMKEGTYKLALRFMSKKKHEPFCAEQPI